MFLDLVYLKLLFKKSNIILSIGRAPALIYEFVLHKGVSWEWDRPFLNEAEGVPLSSSPVHW